MRNVEKLIHWEIDLPDVIYKAGLYQTDFFGYDPGTTHIGVAWTNRHTVSLVQIKMTRAEDAVERMEDLANVLDELFPSMKCTRSCQMHVIEGASYADRFRQVEMAEARATVVWWTKQEKMGESQAHIVSPHSIRKYVFNNFKLRAQDYWETDILFDALAALSCLYYAKFLVENE